MSPVYYVYVFDRGWWGASGTYSSEVSKAMEMTHEQAVAFCKKRYSRMLGVSAVPVLQSDIVELAL